MKSDVTVKLFSEAIKDGVSYPSYVGDDTTEHAEIRLKTLVYYEIEKFVCINHPTRTLGSITRHARLGGNTTRTLPTIAASQTYLPGGKDVTGDDLRACLEDALSHFLTVEAAKKLATV